MNIYKNITLILVTYRSENLIIKNLDILKKFPVIIVDNSNSNQLDSIVERFKNIRVIRSPKNLGYGQGNNLGVSYADTPYILITNPDIVLNENSIEKLLKYFLEDPENIGILGPSLYDKNMRRRTNGSISYINKLKGIKVSEKLNNIPIGNTCCDFLMGCCYLMKRDFFNTLGGFDKNFFMYFEDNDICDRTLKKNKYVIEVPAAKFIHLENSSAKKKFFTDTKLSIIHKVSSYIYLNKNSSHKLLFIHIINNFVDYFLRFFINLIIFRLNKSYKNLLRLISIVLFLTFSYKLIFRIWKI